MNTFNGISCEIHTIDGKNGYVKFRNHSLSPKNIVNLQPPDKIPVSDAQNDIDINDLDNPIDAGCSF